MAHNDIPSQLVEQIDREAGAWMFRTASGWSHESEAERHILSGKGDSSPFVQAFARHRLAALVKPEGETVTDREWPDIGTDPMKGPRPDDRYEASRLALVEAYVRQQPHVPDQTALVWRWHLGTVLEMALRLQVLLRRDEPKPEGETVTDDGLAAACRDMIAQAFDYYKARNGRVMTIQGDDGEKCWIVPFDAFEEVRRLSAASPKTTTVEASGMVERRGEMRAVARIVNVARAIGAQAGVGGRETAGAIVSYLATSPDEIGAFMDGKLSPLDFKGDWMRGGCLSWHAANGKVMHPEDLAAQEEKA